MGPVVVGAFDADTRQLRAVMRKCDETLKLRSEGERHGCQPVLQQQARTREVTNRERSHSSMAPTSTTGPSIDKSTLHSARASGSCGAAPDAAVVIGAEAS